MNKLSLIPENAEYLYKRKLIGYTTYRDCIIKLKYKELKKTMSQMEAINTLADMKWVDKKGKPKELSFNTIWSIVFRPIKYFQNIPCVDDKKYCKFVK